MSCGVTFPVPALRRHQLEPVEPSRGGPSLLSAQYYHTAIMASYGYTDTGAMVAFGKRGATARWAAGSAVRVPDQRWVFPGQLCRVTQGASSLIRDTIAVTDSVLPCPRAHVPATRTQAIRQL